MSGNAKLILSSKPTADEIEAIKKFEPAELSEPVDMDAVSRLIGATKDFVAGARSYLDALEGSAIFSLALSELSKGDREALELSSEVIRSLFDELATTFVEPYRETNPGLAERGYQILWSALRAASIIGQHGAIASERAEGVFDPAVRARLTQALSDEYANARLAWAVEKAIGQTGTKLSTSVTYARSIEANVRSYLEPDLTGDPPRIKKPKTWPSPETIRRVLKRRAKQLKAVIPPA